MMETSVSSKEDRLSTLPPRLIDVILVLLPIKEAVRTSILSHQWRYRWTSIPQVVFNEECLPSPSTDPYVTHLRRVSIVDQVLLCHQGLIHKFRCSQYLPSCPDIHRWITFLSDHPIKGFILECLNDDHYKVPSNLFSYQYLWSLALRNCVVQPPRTYSGFADLTTLKLFSSIISSEALERLLSTCKYLQDLVLMDFQGPTHLKIVGPNLERIYIRGSFQGLHLDTPYLIFADFDLCSRIGEEQEPMREGQGCNLIEALGCLPRIELLKVENYFLKFLALGTVPRKLPTTCTHLEYVDLRIDFSSINQISATCCLIASAPNLQILRLDAYSEEQLDIEEFAWEAHDCQFNCLQSMVMLGINGREHELSLLGFVLSNAPVLKKMTIQFAKDMHVEENKILKKLIRFRRASTLATIECLEDV